MEVKLHRHREKISCRHHYRLKIPHKAQESRACQFRLVVIISTTLEAFLNQGWGLEKLDPCRCLSSLAQDLACRDLGLDELWMSYISLVCRQHRRSTNAKKTLVTYMTTASPRLGAPERF